jgi:non-canonical purine NTP pyrophosphatase (RdgB/HAM1 family)
MADEIYLATGNMHKLLEVRQVLGSRVVGYTLPVNENGKTFEANAIKKARAVMKETGKLTIADDSGLMVDCLGGSPGVRSARFASPPTPRNLCGKLLKLMKDCRHRNARFVCAIAIAYPSGASRVVKGVVNGKIAEKMLGRHGFGYDPVFIPSGYRETFAEMKPAMKNRLSHRGRALRQLKAILG